jgi:hypothetical protein
LALDLFEEPDFCCVSVEQPAMFGKLEQFVKEDRGLDKGLVRYAMVLVLIAAGLFLLLTFIGIKAIDISLMLGSVFGGP